MSTPALAGAQHHDDELNRRRLAAICAQATKLRWQIVAAGIVIAGLAWRVAPQALVIGWFAAMLLTRELRARRLQALAGDESQPIAARLDRLVAWNAAMGIVNGASALFMIWLDLPFDAMLTMIVVSWAAGAVSTNAPLVRAYLAYTSGMLVPLVFAWLFEGTPRGFAIAGLIAMLADVQYRFAKHNAAVFEESYRIRAENDELVRQLAEARDLAEAASHAKSRFLAAASHDLRQPLHALTLHSGLLAQDPYTADAPAIAGEISASIESLARLLDSLLDISKLDAGVVTVDARPIRLHRLAAHLVRSHAPQAAEKGVALHFECPADAVVVTDPVLLERLLRNLLDNAIKYTDRGEVRLVAEAAAGELRLTVSDTGRGIAPEAHQRVFDEFFQVDVPGVPRASGLGLGLAIVRRLARLLELPVTLESAPGSGTRVSLRIAGAPAIVDDEPPSAPQAASLLGTKVLFIDDEEPVRRAMRNVLERFGCEAVGAASSDEVVERARSGAPDLVLADCRLRDGDSGIAAIRRLRDDLPGLPALLISGDTDAERLREAEQSGLRLLHKPVSLAQLREAMRSVLDERPAAAAAATATSAAAGR